MPRSKGPLPCCGSSQGAMTSRSTSVARCSTRRSRSRKTAACTRPSSSRAERLPSPHGTCQQQPEADEADEADEAELAAVDAQPELQAAPDRLHIEATMR